VSYLPSLCLTTPLMLCRRPPCGGVGGGGWGGGGGWWGGVGGGGGRKAEGREVVAWEVEDVRHREEGGIYRELAVGTPGCNG
jgi:hypothetical protein